MRSALTCAAALLWCTTAFSQTGGGEIWGRVHDVDGALVGRADVTLTAVDTGTNRQTRTDDSGRFAFPSVPAGRYQVTAEHDGFAGRRQDDIAIVPGQRLQVDLSLRRAPLPETIALNPYPPIAESARTHASGFVAETEIEHLPIDGRRYLRLAELIPAVSRDAGTGGLSVMNLPSTQNRLLIDGFDHSSGITNDPIGREGPSRVPYQVSQWSVQAFRVQTNAAPAQNGRAAAGLIDVATKAGANAFRGTAYGFLGDRTLNSEKTLDVRAGLDKPEYRNGQFGAVIGGPLIKTHNFFLISYDGVRRTDTADASPNTKPFASAGTGALSQLDAAFARPSRTQRQDLALVRTDHDYFNQHVTVRYIDQQFHGRAIDASAYQPAISSDGAAYLRTRSGAGSLGSALGGHVTNEARVQYADSHDNEASSSTPGIVIFEGGSFVAQTGSSLLGPHAFATKRLQMADSLSWIAGGHSIKVGGDVLKDRHGIRFTPQTTLGYQSIAAFAAGAPDWTTRTFDAGVSVDVDQYAAFAQDAWRVSNALTVDLGVRYDLQDFGALMPRDRNNWAPRVGVSLAPGERKNIFRAAYGLFYGSSPSLIPALAGSDGRVLVDPTFKTARVHQASVGWEVEKYRSGSLGVDYLFARGERLPRTVDINVGGVYPIPGRLVSFQSTAQSIYNGLAFHTRGRVLQQMFYTFAYTVGRSDEAPQQPLVVPFGAFNDRRSLAIQGDTLNTRFPGNNDQHQRFVASAMYDTSVLAAPRQGLSKRLLDDWEIGLVYTWQLGYPYSAYVDGDINRDFNAFNDVAPGTVWNQYRLPYQASFDPRVARRFNIGGTRQLHVVWEAFNLTNRPNFTAVDNTLYTLSGSTLVANPLFGRRTAQAGPRMMQVAARLTF